MSITLIPIRQSILKILFKKQTLVGVLFVSALIALKYFHCTDYLSLAYFHNHLDGLHGLIALHYWYAATIFILSYMLASALSLPGSSFFLTIAGLLFGIVPGVIFANIGATLGATLLFLTSRYVIGDWVQRSYGRYLERYNKEIDEHGASYLLLVRLIAIFPFFSINLLSGLTLLPVRSFMWATSLGMIPISLVFAFAGRELAHVEKIDHFFTPPVMIAFGALIVFKVALVPIGYRYIKHRKPTS